VVGKRTQRGAADGRQFAAVALAKEQQRDVGEERRALGKADILEFI
jgi:hypothetical protein